MRPLWPDWLGSFAAGPRRPQLVCGWLSHPLLAGAPAPPASTAAPSRSSPLRPTSQVHPVPHLHTPPCPTKGAGEDRVFRSVPRSHLPGGSLGSFLLLLVRVKQALATWPGWGFRLAAVRTVGFRTQRPLSTTSQGNGLQGPSGLGPWPCGSQAVWMMLGRGCVRCLISHSSFLERGAWQLQPNPGAEGCPEEGRGGGHLHLFGESS